MSGFDVLMRTDAMIAQNRQFYDAQSHDAMSQTGNAIAQTGRDLTALIQGIQARDMEARFRAQQLEIDRQFQVEKLEMMKQIHATKMSELGVEATKLQVEQMRWEQEQRTKEQNRPQEMFSSSLRAMGGAREAYALGLYPDPSTYKFRSRDEFKPEEWEEIGKRLNRPSDSSTRLEMAELRQAFYSQIDEKWTNEEAAKRYHELGGIPYEGDPKAAGKDRRQGNASELRSRLKSEELSSEWLDRAVGVMGTPEFRGIVSSLNPDASPKELEDMMVEIINNPDHRRHKRIVQILGRMGAGENASSPVSPLYSIDAMRGYQR